MTSVTVKGLSAGKKYRAQVAAGNKSAWSSYSEFSESAAISGPKAPERPTIEVVDASSLRVQWKPVEHLPQVAWYAVAIHDGSLKYYDPHTEALASERVGGLAADKTSIVIKGLSAGKKYKAQVTAGNDVGWSEYSAFSEVATITSPEPPPRPTVEIIDGSSILVEWSPAEHLPKVAWYALAVHDGTMKYYDPQTGTLAAERHGFPATTTSVVVSGLVPGKRYRAQVAAGNEVGWGNYSSFSNAVVISREVASQKKAPSLGTPKKQAREAECTICFSEPPNVAFDPCGHLCVCKSCAAALSSCPLCRASIAKRLRIYTSC
jgi:hypothetical protein